MKRRKPNNSKLQEAIGFKPEVEIDQILDEMIEFFKYHKLMGTVAGGIHLESTSRNVSEIINTVDDSIDPARYETKCDPRLNGTQTLQLMNILLDYMSKN